MKFDAWGKKKWNPLTLTGLRSFIKACFAYDIQVSSKYKMCSQIFEPPPPTDQTEHARGLKFCMASPHDSLLRVIEAIFDKSPLSRDMGVGWGTLGGAKNIQKIFPNF